MKSKKIFTKNLFWVTFGTYLSNAISLVVTIYIIRKLSIEDFGIYSMFLGSITFFTIISSSGIIVAMRRFIPEISQKKFYKYLKNIINKLNSVATLICIILIIIVFFFRTKFGEILNIKDFGVYYSIFSINIFLFIHKSLYGVELVSFQKQKFLAIIGILSVILRGLTYLILLKFISLKIIFFIEAGTLAVVAIPSFIYIKIILNKLNKSKSNDLLINERRNYKKRILRYGLLSTSNEMGSSILSEVSDYYLISVYMGPTFMGLYAFPHKILKLVLRWFPITKFVNMIRPLYLDKYYENNENKEYLQKMFNFMIKIMMLIYGIITSIVITYQNLINEYLFASKYKNTESLLIIIFTFSFLSFFIHPVNLIMEATENIQYNLYAKIFAIINVFSVIMILKFTNYGLFGVAIATGLSNFLKNYFIYFFMKQRIRIFFNKVDLLKSSLVIIIFFIIIQIGYKIPYLYLKIFLPLICGSFFIMFFINKIMLFNFEERKQILKIFNKNYTIRKFIRRISGKVY